MAVSWAQFGSSDRDLYAAYLATYLSVPESYSRFGDNSELYAQYLSTFPCVRGELGVVGDGSGRVCGDFLLTDGRVCLGTLGSGSCLRVGAAGGVGDACGDFGEVCRDGKVCSEGVGNGASFGSESGVKRKVGGAALGGDAREVCGGSYVDRAKGEVSTPVCAVGGGSQRDAPCTFGVGSGIARGKNYVRNKNKRENKKRKMQRDWRSGSEQQKEDAESDATVVTVDTKTAEEIQAKRSLAVRRTMENKVATALAAHKLRSLKDKSRTDAVEKLAAARFEQRINEAKAKSQSSFKQCDQSLKSLGSSGSAGEFALKQEVKRAQDDKKLLDYVQKQLDIAIKCATPAAIAAINALPAPEFQDEFEAFGDCPSDYDEDEAQAYYNQLNARNQELADIANVGF